MLDCFIGCDPSGWELLQVLSLDVELQRVPVVICTTDVRVFDSESNSAVDDGIQILPKPFELQVLLGAISRALAVMEAPTGD